MKHTTALSAMILTLATALAATPAAGELTIAPIFSDGVVLQRELPVTAWGQADPGAAVTVAFAGQTATGRAGDDGEWRVTLEPLSASAEARELTVSAGDETLTVKDVLVGEVWVCSGQSNMEFALQRAETGKDAAAEADRPTLRQFRVARARQSQPVDTLKGAWTAATPQTAGGFSAVAFFFGVDIQDALDVPVGLIVSAWGGTEIVPWTPIEGFRAVEGFEGVVKKLANRPADAKVNEKQPAALYNGMVAPVVPFAARGVLWYQGETDVIGHEKNYLDKMRALTAGWRAVWGRDDMPFYYVQVAPFHYQKWFKRYPDADALPRIWQAQLEALTIPHTGMAVIHDISTVEDIHPPKKAGVGHRLALWALAETYGRDELVYSGPLVTSAEATDGRVVVRFEHVADGLKSADGEPLTHWELAGPDGKWHPAAAEIAGDTVVVSSDKVDDPAAVRFAWHEMATPNLVNSAGLPAAPFHAKVE